MILPDAAMNVGYFLEVIMNTENERTQIKNPTFQKTINGTTYVVRLHFNESAGETMEDKIKRLLRNEISETPLFERK